MSNSIKIFENNQFGQIRTVEKDGEPWFVAKDICDALAHSDVSMACSKLSPDEKGTSIVCTPGGKQKMTIINESGLYALIFTSRLEKAQEFRHWVTSEVLPSIRKTGSYSTKPELNVKALPSVNHAVSLLHKTFKVAGGNPASLGNMVVSLYRGIGVPVPALEAKVAEHLFDSEEIAAKIGILSESGKPHSHATKAVIRDLGFTDDDGTISTYERNGHSGTVVKYPPNVVDAVIEWFERKNWPRVIVLDKAYKVRYNP